LPLRESNCPAAFNEFATGDVSVHASHRKGGQLLCLRHIQHRKIETVGCTDQCTRQNCLHWRLAWRLDRDPSCALDHVRSGEQLPPTNQKARPIPPPRIMPFSEVGFNRDDPITHRYRPNNHD
jgi:hypothetical protein